MMMKRILSIILTSVLILGMTTLAAEGEMGYMGGVSEGSNLPFVLDKYVPTTKATTNSYQYKEVVFLFGVPSVVEGTITVTKPILDLQKNPEGSYNESYTVSATSSTDGTSVERTISFTTKYKNYGGEFKNQIITNSVLTGWSETVSQGDVTYTLDPDMSSYSKAGVTDMTPGVTYFETSVSYVGRYLNADGYEVILSGSGANYGYDQPWSKIEIQDRDIELDFELEDYEDVVATTNSVLEAKKTIYYDATEPYPISFDGTYNQRMEREGTLTYEVLTYHPDLEQGDYTGSATIQTANQIEKLPIPVNLDFIEGHWAEDDIKKLYSMEIFTDIPRDGMQYEAITRGDYVKALCLAMNIDTTDYVDGTEIIFADVLPTNPYYPYVMAAYDKKLVKGTGASFDVSRPINREEAFVIYIRIIGLERLGVTNAPVTPFVDDGDISSWARKEIMAGYKLGIIQGDSTGNVYPQKWISKAEAAAIINRLIDYLRSDIGQDYRQ